MLVINLALFILFFIYSPCWCLTVVYPENYEEQCQKNKQKEIEIGILKAISEISNETDWPEEADADDIQSIITQLARSAAHLRDANTSIIEKALNNKTIDLKKQ